MSIKDDLIFKDASKVLKTNDLGSYTQPADRLYPHQWLWDSCFIAIGLRHIDIERAQTELTSLLRGQWHNGMMPDMIFRDELQYRATRDQWRSWLNPYAPDHAFTSGITQPPMLAEAVYRVGKLMTLPERRLWFKKMLPTIINFHQWLYNDRDPHKEGLVLQIHPWETGMDNSPTWMSELHGHLMPFWIRGLEKLKVDGLIKLVRTDTKTIPVNQRTAIYDSLAMYDTQLRLRRKAYDINKILDHSLFSIEDLAYNCIFIRANSLLIDIAATCGVKLDSELIKRMHKTAKALEELWDPLTNQYYSRDFVTHRLIKTPSLAGLLPLYAGTISKERAASLVEQINNEHSYNTPYPLPTVPISSDWYKPDNYWQGPTWLNSNWLVANGLNRYGYKKEANNIIDRSIKLVRKSGYNEYFDTYSAKPLGAANFSWTAAMAIDFIYQASRQK